ncbi:hypothetical protein ACVWYN_002029 [Pedobacter sp. UYP24]
MNDHQLNNIDSYDIDELLLQVEKSFDIKFAPTEFSHVTTFGELCDCIANKIELENSEDCTTQQAFYKLRQSIATELSFNLTDLTTTTLIIQILPRPTRISKVKELEKHLGFKLNILRPRHSINGSLIFILIASIISVFFNWKIGASGFSISVIGLWLANKVGKEIDLTTLGQLAEKMTRENYIKSRRNPKTFNKKEVEAVLTDWFADQFDLEKTKLTRCAKLV